MNLTELWNNKTVKVLAVAIAVIAVAVGVWSVLDASGNSPSWLPAFPGAAKGLSAEATSSVKPDGTADKAVATVTPTANNDGSGEKAPSGDTNTTTPTDPKDDTSADPVKPAVPGQSMDLRVLLWNDTDTKAPDGLEVAIGSIKWTPADPTLKSQAGELGAVAIGKVLDLEVYPDGRQGKKITVKIKLTADMRSGSEADAVHVEVRDSQVRVLGTPVENFDVSVERFN